MSQHDPAAARTAAGRRTHADVLVVGAGAVGAATAAELAGRGRTVAVLERGADWAAGASWGNAGLICPSHAGPWATSADVVQGMRWMLRRDSPLGLRPRPSLVPFLGRLLTMPAAVTERSRSLSRALCRESLALHEELAAGDGTGFARRGLLDVYGSRAGFERGTAGAAGHRANGVRCEVLDAAQVRAAEPGLSTGVAGGVLFPDEAHCDPAAYVEAEAARALRRGARFFGRTEVLAIDAGSPAAGAAARLVTTRGEFTGEEVVVAAGAWSASLARALGVRIPLQPGKGYSLDLDGGGCPPPARPLMLQEARVAVTPLAGRLRLAGTMEFGGLDEHIDRRRLGAVHRAGVAALPAWAHAPVRRRWAGLRPCTPDGLPLVGRLPTAPRITLATGHAMLGLTLAPLTGKQVADLLDDHPDPRLAALAPLRHRRAAA